MPRLAIPYQALEFHALRKSGIGSYVVPPFGRMVVLWLLAILLPAVAADSDAATAFKIII